MRYAARTDGPGASRGVRTKVRTPLLVRLSGYAPGASRDRQLRCLAFGALDPPQNGLSGDGSSPMRLAASRTAEKLDLRSRSRTSHWAMSFILARTWA